MQQTKEKQQKTINGEAIVAATLESSHTTQQHQLKIDSI